MASPYTITDSALVHHPCVGGHHHDELGVCHFQYGQSMQGLTAKELLTTRFYLSK